MNLGLGRMRKEWGRKVVETGYPNEERMWAKSVGERSNFKKIPTITQDLSRRSIAMSGESVSTYPRRPKAEVLSNAVDVVKRLRDPTDQVPNARHLRDLHKFSSVTSLEL